jgi:diguanylate cyclase (GGDEF)-like protein
MTGLLKTALLFAPPGACAGAALLTPGLSPVSVLMITASIYSGLAVALWLYHARGHEALKSRHVDCAARNDRIQRKLREMQGRIDVLTAEREIGLILNESIEFDRIMDRVLGLIREALSMREGDLLQIYLRVDDGSTVLVCECTRGVTRRIDKEQRDSVVDQALRRAGPAAAGGGDRIELAVPLTHDREVIGALKLRLGLRGTPELRQEKAQFLTENVAEVAKFVSLAIKTRDLYSRAVEDALTGLATKRHFLSQLDQHVEAARRHGEPLSLIMVDIDHFKKVNDTHGHATGDLVLREVGQILLKNIRKGGDSGYSGYRFGGEELSVLLPRADVAKAAQVAERIRRAVEGRTFRTSQRQPLRVTVSLGVGEWKPQMLAADLIETADAALYRAKHAGRNRVC